MISTGVLFKTIIIHHDLLISFYIYFCDGVGTRLSISSFQKPHYNRIRI